MAEVAEGRTEAIRVLYARHAGWVFARAQRRLDAAAAEEIVQEVFFGIFRAREAFDPTRGSFRAWIAEATRRRVLNELRRRARKATGDDVDLDALPAGDADPDEAAWRAYRTDAVTRAIEALPEPQRRALRLAFFDDLSHEEIASLLHLPLGTAKTRIRSGLKKLGAALAVLALAAALVWVIRDERSARSREARALSMVTASDADRIRLSPPGAAGEAPDQPHGHYRFRPGSPTVVVNLSHLAPPPAGESYRVWARAGGRTIALGTATPDAAGKAILVAEDTALASRPDEVWVTLGEGRVLVSTR